MGTQGWARPHANAARNLRQTYQAVLPSQRDSEPDGRAVGGADQPRVVAATEGVGKQVSLAIIECRRSRQQQEASNFLVGHLVYSSHAGKVGGTHRDVAAGQAVTSEAFLLATRYGRDMEATGDRSPAARPNRLDDGVRIE
jgi:hypothetical protein